VPEVDAEAGLAGHLVEAARLDLDPAHGRHRRRSQLGCDSFGRENALGCRGQGYYYSKSVSGQAIMAILARAAPLHDGAAEADRTDEGELDAVVLELLEGGKGKG